MHRQYDKALKMDYVKKIRLHGRYIKHGGMSIRATVQEREALKKVNHNGDEQNDD